METMMKEQGIPQTDSIAALAHFWDPHDLTDFEDELEEVVEPVFERAPEATVTIRFPRQEMEAIMRLAKARGIGHRTLIRQWVREKLQVS
jgi:predicted DNA binding CopG/RHH family protein